uniref:NTPase, KAP family P-loop domain containing 1 n=2 Tax=Latimeria chalumnae TaxID=7897 RepID=H3AAV0_LATCH
LREETYKSNSKELKRTKQNIRTVSGKNAICLLFRILFCYPALTRKQKERKNIRYIFIRFSAWEYAGSDKLWAGLITTLCDTIQHEFGSLLLSAYRAIYRKKQDIINTDQDEEWRTKKFLWLPLWLPTIFLLLVSLVLLTFVLATDFPANYANKSVITAMEGIGAAGVGLSVAAVIRTVSLFAKNLFVTQRAEIEWMMNRTDLSAQLGFMSHVKEEVELITRFLQFMEIFERTKIRIVLLVTQLDMCPPKKVVEVLDAMNILLSNKDAPFISVLAVDPSIIVSCLESTTYFMGMEEKDRAENGYDILNRTIHLPFSLPEMSCDTKRDFLETIVQGKSLMKDGSSGKRAQEEEEQSQAASESQMLLSIRGENGGKQEHFKTEELANEALNCLLSNKLFKYITDNIIQMRRIANTVIITTRLVVKNLGKKVYEPETLAAWVILANHWPCRLSWILQCVEDERQRKETDAVFEEKPLWDIFEVSMEELYVIKKDIEKLLELDGDPDLFETFLKRDCAFKVKDVNNLMPCTVNLDRSLKRQIALLRSSNDIK